MRKRANAAEVVVVVVEELVAGIKQLSIRHVACSDDVWVAADVAVGLRVRQSVPSCPARCVGLLT